VGRVRAAGEGGDGVGGERGPGAGDGVGTSGGGRTGGLLVDLPREPCGEWQAVRGYVERMAKGGRMEYVAADVTDQGRMWELGQKIGDKEGRMDVCVAAAGIAKPQMDCLTYPEEDFRKVREAVWQERGIDNGRQHERSAIHCAGGGAANGAVREYGEHHHDSVDKRERHEQGKLQAVLPPSRTGLIGNDAGVDRVIQIEPITRRPDHLPGRNAGHRCNRAMNWFLTTRVTRRCCTWCGAWHASYRRKSG
jgi:Enoyl-(Acyl carrier protein) reductase